MSDQHADLQACFQGRKALVTGAGGFLGGAISRQLLTFGCEVHGLQRGDYPALQELGVVCHRGDLANAALVNEAAQGCDFVFHVAAKAGVWGSRASYHTANVQGTDHILAACKNQGVKHLVYTSSPSVVFDGSDEKGVDESAPYASKHLCHYSATKATAEAKVLAAHTTDLRCVALRPHLIWGPGDTNLVPRILARARAGALKLVGPGSNRVDSTYIDNAVSAHLLAAKELSTPSPACGGKAYFISNGEPMPLKELIDGILHAGGLPPVTKQVPPTLAYMVGALLEAVWTMLGRQQEPLMTRFVARQLATEHFFDLSAARQDFGYEAQIPIATGLKHLQHALQQAAQGTA